LYSGIAPLTVFSFDVGGDGVNGQDGRRDAVRSDVREKEFYKCDRCHDFRPCRAHPQYMYHKYLDKDSGCLEPFKSLPLYVPGDHDKCKISYFGQRGESGDRGGNAGKAGCGGFSGYSGQSVIIAYQNRINEKKESSSTAKRSQQGQSGKVGRGGKSTTAMIKKGYYIRTSFWCYFDSDGIQEPNEYFSTYDYADSGIQPTECSPLFYNPSVPSKPIALYQLETDYVHFINEQNSALFHSSLVNRSFLTHIMNRRSKYGQALLTF